MKPDESTFLVALLRLHGCEPYGRGCPDPKPLADQIGEKLGMHGKRIHYILEKWCGRWWDCGVSLRTGWFTEEAFKDPRFLPFVAKARASMEMRP